MSHGCEACILNSTRYFLRPSFSASPPPRFSPSFLAKLGAGTALPTALIFSEYLSRDPSWPGSNSSLSITLADYNDHVLSLATVPNLLLVWASLQKRYQPWPDDGDLEITPRLLADFQTWLAGNHILIRGISGAWGPAFVTIATQSSASVETRPFAEPEVLRLVLASETIYSPSSLRAFTHTVLSLLSEAQSGSGLSFVCLVAAKRIYFGVGGGVDEFRRMVEEMGGYVEEVWASGSGAGVERCILRVGHGRGRI
jgi:protein-histidine N-methyltransferase